MGNCCGPQKAYNEPPDDVATPPSTADAPATPSGPLARDGPKSVVLACLDGPCDSITEHLRAKPELEELRIEAASLGNVGASQGLGAAFEAMTRSEAEKLVIDAFDKDPEGATVSFPEFVSFVGRARGQLDAAEA